MIGAIGQLLGAADREIAIEVSDVGFSCVWLFHLPRLKRFDCALKSRGGDRAPRRHEISQMLDFLLFDSCLGA